MEHNHNWQLIETIEGKKRYRGMAVGTSVLEYCVGKDPDVSKFVCECGATKKVEHNE